MTDTIFSKIIRGELPCHKVYEDDHVLAFLDIAPVSSGHVLVIPKQYARTLDEVDEASAQALGRALVLVSRAVKRVTGCAAFNVLQNNEAAAYQSVMHVHFHVIPKPSEAEGLGVRWPSRPLDQATAPELAARLRDGIAAEG